MKKYLLIILTTLMFIILIILGLRFLTPEDTWICKNGSWEKHGNPNDVKPDMRCE